MEPYCLECSHNFFTLKTLTVGCNSKSFKLNWIRRIKPLIKWRHWLRTKKYLKSVWTSFVKAYSREWSFGCCACSKFENHKRQSKKIFMIQNVTDATIDITGFILSTYVIKTIYLQLTFIRLSKYCKHCLVGKSVCNWRLRCQVPSLKLSLKNDQT